MAEFVFKHGAMNSGKSSLLVMEAFNLNERGYEVVVIKPSVDTKGGDKVIARAGLERSVDILIPPDVNARAMIQQYLAEKALGQAQVGRVLADEAQFFQPDQVSQLHQLSKFDDVPVTAYGLKVDYQTHFFPGSQRFSELADVTEELQTICRCKKNATLNGRKDNGVFVFEDAPLVAIDHELGITYEALCGDCYLEEQAKALAS